MKNMNDVMVIKLGGSLLDVDDLAQRIAVVRGAIVPGPAAMIVGGAEAADVVRRFDRLYQLGEVNGHWLAVRAMQFNAHVVAATMRDAVVVCDRHECDAAWRDGRLAIVDPLEWLRREEEQGVTIPHRWTFTSDSIAAHVAVRIGAGGLLLLKSRLPDDAEMSVGGEVENGAMCGMPRDDVNMRRAVTQGLVDADFAATSRGIPSIEVINLRHASLAAGRVDAAARCVLR